MKTKRMIRVKPKTTLGNNILLCLGALGWSVTKAMVESGVDRAVIYTWMSNTYRPSMDGVMSLVSAFRDAGLDVSVEDLNAEGFYPRMK